MTKTLNIFLLLFVAFSIGPVCAEESNQSDSKSKAFSFDTSLTYSSNLYQIGSFEHSSDFLSTFEPNYQLSKKLKLGGYFALSKTLADEKLLLLNDAKLSLTHKSISLNPSLSYTPAVIAILPLSDVSREETKLYAGLRLSQKLSTKEGTLGHFDLGYTLNSTLNFHQYETSGSGSSNTRFSLGHRLLTTYNFLPTLSFSLLATQTTGWAYQFKGTPVNTYTLNQELAYQATPEIAIALGHTNDGTAFKENGRDLNVQIINSRTSIIYSTLVFSY